MACAKALRRFVASADAEGIPIRLQYAPGAAPNGDGYDGVLHGTALLFDVTFVDDEAIVLVVVYDVDEKDAQHVALGVPRCINRRLRESLRLITCDSRPEPQVEG